MCGIWIGGGFYGSNVSQYIGSGVVFGVQVSLDCLT